jgi:hypothetical protein
MSRVRAAKTERERALRRGYTGSSGLSTHRTDHTRISAPRNYGKRNISSAVSELRVQAPSSDQFDRVSSPIVDQTPTISLSELPETRGPAIVPSKPSVWKSLIDDQIDQTDQSPRRSARLGRNRRVGDRLDKGDLQFAGTEGGRFVRFPLSRMAPGRNVTIGVPIPRFTPRFKRYQRDVPGNRQDSCSQSSLSLLAVRLLSGIDNVMEERKTQTLLKVLLSMISTLRTV